MEGPLLCLVNPASGRGRALAKARAFRDLLVRAGREVSLEESREPGWMARRAAQADAGTAAVIAVGGDGTVNEVARGLAGRGIPLAVLPAGTLNLLARVYRLPEDPEGLIQLLHGGKTLPLDLGTAGERVFLSCAGAGFDAEVIRSLHRSRRGPIRIWHYLPHLLAQLARPLSPRIRAHLDGKDPGAFSQVIVGNLPLYAGILRFTPDARADDGLLDVALFRGGRRRDLLRYAAAAAWGRRADDVLLRRAREVRLEAPDPLPLQLDGDEAGTLPALLSVRPAAIRLVVP